MKIHTNSPVKTSVVYIHVLPSNGRNHCDMSGGIKYNNCPGYNSFR